MIRSGIDIVTKVTRAMISALFKKRGSKNTIVCVDLRGDVHMRTSNKIEVFEYSATK